MQQSTVFRWKKKKDFPTKNVLIFSLKNLSGYGWCCTKHRITELHGRQTKSYFLRFASGHLISTTAHLIGVKQRKLCWYVKFSQWKGQFWIQEVIRARLETCLRLSLIDANFAKQVNKIRLLKILFVKKLLWVNWTKLLCFAYCYSRLSPCYC